jgi:hypothetical protein
MLILFNLDTKHHLWCTNHKCTVFNQFYAHGSVHRESTLKYLVAHLHRIKIFSHNYCTTCKLKNTSMDKDHLLVCPKLDHTSKELSKLYWDARRLME